MQMIIALRFTILALALSIGCLVPSSVRATDPAANGDLLSALRLESGVRLCGETVPVGDPRVLERHEKEMLLALGNRPQVFLWLKRTSRYFPYIEQSLAQNDLPDDIKFLAIAESALRMHAGSRKGAMGVWQLMPQTARRYGLIVNRDFDERRNLYLSTPAAMAYLKELHHRFGTWSLALAAYNMGEQGLEAEILEQGISDYYRLYLPLETQRFIFRILAIKRIVQDPAAYGFPITPDDRYLPESFASVRIDAIAEIPLRLIADAAGTDFKSIKDLNPELRGHYLSAGTRTVNIPEEGRQGFQARLTAGIDAHAQRRSQRLYEVKPGDSLSGIAHKFDVPLAALLIWNRIGINKMIHPGQRLVVFPGTDSPHRDQAQNDGGAGG